MARKKYKRTVKNKIRDFGDTDTEKKVIRINKKKSRKAPGGIIDTIVHEELHASHPKMHEKTVRRKTKRMVKSMSQKRKSKLRGRFR